MTEAEEPIVTRQTPSYACRCVMQILWPSFLMAALADGILFSMIHPQDVSLVHDYLADDPLAAYTFAFMGFWALFAASSALTLFLAQDRMRELAAQA